MGCCPPSKDEAGQAEIPTGTDAVSFTEGAERVAAAFELSGVDIQLLADNPLEVTEEALKSAMGSISVLFNGVKPHLSLTFPIEMVARCLMNKVSPSGCEVWCASQNDL